jgi:hypothetical protein
MELTPREGHFLALDHPRQSQCTKNPPAPYQFGRNTHMKDNLLKYKDGHPGILKNLEEITVKI